MGKVIEFPVKKELETLSEKIEKQTLEIEKQSKMILDLMWRD